MPTEEEIMNQRAKLEALQAAKGSDPYAASSNYGAINSPKQSLRQNIKDQLYIAQHNADRAAKLQELQCLFDKYPDIARMLDLLQEIGN